MGVPVVTLAGKAHRSRVGVTLLTCAGLQDLAADEPGGYVRIASDLAANGSRLQELRRTLRDRLRTGALTDALRFTRGLETAYRHAWSAARAFHGAKCILSLATAP